MSYIDAPWFSLVDRPSRYIGHEVGAIRKDPESGHVLVALCFPDVYEVGMSHVGLKILYDILNSEDWIAAERVFCPWIDMEHQLRLHDEPLVSLESGRPLKDFDIVGFSLQHELCYTNVLTMLDLGAIPLLAKDRKGRDPLVIGGGPMCFNPEPVADFFDLFVVGDGEEALVDICRITKRYKDSPGSDRQGLLRELSRIQGVYVPSFFEIKYSPSGVIASIKPVHDDYPAVTKAMIPDLGKHSFPIKQVIPYTQLVHDRLAVEIARGCTRGCRFCQAGMIYRPVRERGMGSIIKTIELALQNTGYEEISLLSLSAGDYACIETLLKALMDKHAPERIALSLPSLRIDSISPVFMEEIKRVRKTGFTLAVEAGSERLRRIINKGLTREEILRMAREVYGAGWDLIKLYFMVGLPYEEDGDLRDTAELAREIASLSRERKGGEHLTVSVAAFVPKPHTPFMWASQVSTEEAARRIDFLHRALRKSRVRLKTNPPEQSYLEGIFSRGDRRLSALILEAWRKGARFDSWGEIFRKDIWDQSLKSLQIAAEFYLERPRREDEIFPWEHIKTGVSKEFLWSEWLKAASGQTTADCRSGCLDCGVCDHVSIKPVLAEADVQYSARKTRHNALDADYTYRLLFRKTGPAVLLGHLEMAKTFFRAFRRASLPLSYSKGFHPLPKVSFAQALAVGIESHQESMEIQLTARLKEEEIISAVNMELPPFLNVYQARALTEVRAGSERILESVYQVRITGSILSPSSLEAFERAQTLLIEKEGKRGKRPVDVKRAVKHIRFLSPEEVELGILHTEGPLLRPSEAVKTIFGLSSAESSDMHIVKVKQISTWDKVN